MFSMSHPIEVRRFSEEQRLQIKWNDGHVSDYAFDYLRGWCPCAACQGHSGERRFVRVKETDLTTIGVVGKYALGLTWSDGHDTGIYSYSYLRGLCPCTACRPSGS